MIKAIIILSVFLILALAIKIFELLDKAITALERLTAKKYTVTYLKPSQSMLESFYCTIKAHSINEAKRKLYKQEGGCYIFEVKKA